jgi:transcription initiation factor TFIIA large subunit
VIQASNNDFEESGVDQSTLDEMKQVCDSLAATRPSHLPSVIAAPSSRFTTPLVVSIVFFFLFVVSLSYSLRLTMARCCLAWE